MTVFLKFLFTKQNWTMRTRQEERKQLQSNKRKADAAAVTRNETALNDGVYKRERQQAEDHIATLVCRFASFDSSTKKWRLVKGKPKEVFELHAGKTYSNLNLGFTRVMDRVYKHLKQRNVPVTYDKETNVSRCELNFTLELKVGFIKPCFCLHEQ